MWRKSFGNEAKEVMLGGGVKAETGFVEQQDQRLSGFCLQLGEVGKEREDPYVGELGILYCLVLLLL